MAYTIYKSDGVPVTVADNSVDNVYYNPVGGTGGASGLGTQLVGRNTINYGAPIAQNFLQLTENFCSLAVPSDTTSLQGQLWFNQTSGATGNLYVRKSGNTTGGIGNWNKVVVEDASGNVSITGTVTATTFIGSVSNANVSVNIAGGLIGYLPYQSAVNTTALLPPGTTGQVLTSNGAAAPSWQTVALPSNTPTINPVGTPKDGDIRVVGSVISIYAAGAWQQVFPAVYS